MKIKFKNLDKYTKLAIITILIGILLRFSLASIYYISGDACWHLSVGRFIAENGEIPLFEGLGRSEPFWPPPLFHFLVAFTYNIFNIYSSEAANFSIKFISPIFGSLTLIFSYLTFRKFQNQMAAFYSILFLSFIPISIDYSILGYVESMLTFLVVLSLYFALNNRLVLSAITAGFSILTKYNGIFVIPVLLFIIYRYGNKRVLLKNFFIPRLVIYDQSTIYVVYLMLHNARRKAGKSFCSLTIVFIDKTNGNFLSSLNINCFFRHA